MVFKTNGVDKMSIVNNGISVSGNVVVSGLITSTGAGFSGLGAGLTNIPISAINELRLELNGGTTELSVTRDTLNASIVSEARFGSNYTNRINSELNTRVDNTSNYVFATSNILIGRIINTSNYVDSTSNFLSGRLDNTSNYVFATSNILIGRIINTSNYVDSTSNFLSGRIDNTSNYALATSNILIGRLINTCNYVDSTSNFLGGRIDNTSNYALATSNILIGRIINTSNYVESTSNTLIGRVINASNYVESTSNTLIGRIINASNYIESTSNTLIGRVINASNYVDSTSNFLSGRIDNTSNYVFATSNILIGRIINTSNYVDITSNFLAGRIDNTSNYAFTTSNILIGRVINASNYVDSTSNLLAGRIDNTSNYVFATSNILIGRIINASNYTESTSNILIGRIINASNYTESTSNTLIGRVINASNYVESTSNILIGRLINTSNYVDSTSNFLAGRIDNTSNYVFATSNILIGRLINTSNYVDSTSNLLAGRIDNTSNYVNSTSNILIGRIVNTSNYVSSYKPATAVTADFANRFTNSVNIAGVPFNGTANISISYNSLDNQLSFGNGLSTSYDNITKITSVTANAAPQEQSDWTQTSTSSASFIKNKPTIPSNTFQLNGSIAFYNSGNVGIGTNAPLSLLEIITANYTGALLTLDAGVVNSTTQMPRNIGRPLLKLGKTSYSTSAGNYYGIGFGISPTLSDYNCAEIGTIITSTTGLETGDIIFSTRPGTNNVIATERMRITSAGNVGIGTTDTSTYKLNVGGDINIASGSSFRVGGNVLSTFTPSSANLIGSFSSTQFENVSSLIQIKSAWKPTTAGTADTANALASGSAISTGTITASGLITANAGLTIPSGQTLTSSGTLTASVINASGLISANAGLTIPAGKTLISSGTLNADVVTTGTITASGLITANAGISVPSGQTLTSSGTLTASAVTASTITASGLITANAGISVPSGQTLTSLGNISANTITTSGNVGIGTSNTTNHLNVYNKLIMNNGIVAIQTSGFAFSRSFMSTGSLVIGNIDQDYGGLLEWNNRASLLIECYNTAEIMVHAYAVRLASFMYYSNNKFFIGRTTGNSGITPTQFYFLAGIWYNSSQDKNVLHIEESSRLIFRPSNTTNDATQAFMFQNGNGSDSFTILTNGSFSARGTNLAWSDKRYKKDIEDINDDSALQMILAITPKTYRYIDETKGTDIVYGFIAQQIKEVIPEAVEILYNMMPNIYKLCRCEGNKKIYVVLPKDALGSEIEIRDIGKYKISKVEDEYIEVVKYLDDKVIPDGDNFVYGYAINDFHMIKKEYIFTLNVCATQELHKRIENQNIVIKSLEDRIKELETKMTMLLNNL
jgi:hypothetical protein